MIPSLPCYLFNSAVTDIGSNQWITAPPVLNDASVIISRQSFPIDPAIATLIVIQTMGVLTQKKQKNQANLPILV